MKIRSLHNAHISQHENVARAVYYISPLGSSQNMPPLAQRHSPHPTPIFASNINQVNNVNVARAVYYISPLGSSQNMPHPLPNTTNHIQRHPPHPTPSFAPITNLHIPKGDHTGGAAASRRRSRLKSGTATLELYDTMV